MRELLLSRRLILAHIITGAVILNFLRVYLSGPAGFDFAVMWQSGLLPLGDIYSPHPDGPFVYPPTALVWLQPYSFLPFGLSYALWSIVGVAAFWLASANYGPARWLALLALPVTQCLFHGQTSLLLAAAILAAFQLPSLWRGVLIGLVLTIKPQLVILAPFLFMRDRETLVGLAAGSLASVAVSLTLFGVQPWFDWIVSLGGFHSELVARNVISMFVTPAGWAEYFGLPIAPFWILGIALGLMVLRFPDKVVALVAGSLLASPYAVGYDLVVLMPWAASVLWQRRVSWWTIPATLTFFGVWFPVVWAGICLALIQTSRRVAAPA